MVVFLYGPDDYRRHNRKAELVERFTKKYSGLAVGRFDGESKDVLDALGGFIRNQSIFESAKLAMLDNAFAIDAPKLAKALEPALNTKATTILISEKDKPVKALAFLLKAPVVAEQFENLEAAELKAFIKEEAKKLGVTVADAAAQFLAAVFQNNAWGLVTELQKISSMKPGGAIDKNDLNALDLEAAPNYWMLLNGLKSQDGRTRLSTLERLFALNDPPPKIFNILAAQAGEKTAKMAEYDFAVKSGKIDYEEALLDLILA